MGLDIKLVDLHIDRLFSEDHRLTKPMAGLYVPREVRASRAVNVMAVPGSGGCKLEVGDDVIDLTPWEARMAVGMRRGWLSRFEPAIASKGVRRRRCVAPLRLPAATRPTHTEASLYPRGISRTTNRRAPMAITRTSILATTATIAPSWPPSTVTAANYTGTTPTDSERIWTGFTMVSVGLCAIEPVRERVRRAGRSLVDGFMATARHQLHIRHKLIAQAHDAVAAALQPTARMRPPWPRSGACAPTSERAARPHP